MEKLNIIPWQIISLGGGLKNIKLVFWVYFVVMLKSQEQMNSLSDLGKFDNLTFCNRNQNQVLTLYCRNEHDQ
jgi:hypothetical protein